MGYFAARAPWISPSAVLHAGQAGGCDSHWHGHVLADHLRARSAVFHIDCLALAQSNFLEIVRVGAVGALGPGAGVGVIVEHARHAFHRQPAQHAVLRRYAQVFDTGDDVQGSLLIGRVQVSESPTGPG